MTANEKFILLKNAKYWSKDDQTLYNGVDLLLKGNRVIEVANDILEKDWYTVMYADGKFVVSEDIAWLVEE